MRELRRCCAVAVRCRRQQTLALPLLRHFVALALLSLAAGPVLLADAAVAKPAVEVKSSKRASTPQFVYTAVSIDPITSLEEFHEKVTSVVNITAAEGEEAKDVALRPSADYYPVVFFHLSVCEPCKAALPELDVAAREILEQFNAGEGRGEKLVRPKFFSVECDKVSKDFVLLCDKQVGWVFPTLLVYREARVFRFFNRPRTQNAFGWWIMRIIRPFLRGVQSVDDLQKAREPTFVMKASLQDNKKMIMWAKIASSFLEGHSFAIMDPKTPGSEKLPLLSLWAPDRAGLSPLPFVGELENSEQVEAWVGVNRFPALGNCDHRAVLMEYQRSNMKVVGLLHEGDTAALKDFTAVAESLRPSGNYIFVAVDASDEKEMEVLTKKFSLLAPAVCTYPRIFGIEGNAYFEDPDLRSLEAPPGSASVDEVLEGFFQNVEARQDVNLWMDYVKAKRKVYMRFAAKTPVNTALAVVIPIIALAFCYVAGNMIYESLLRGDDEDEEGEAKAIENEKKKDS